MTIQRRCISSQLPLLLYASSAVAQAGDTAIQKITIDDAIRFAVRNNPDLENSRLESAKADARVSEAWGYTMPSIDVTGQYSQALKKSVFFLPGSFVGQPQKDVVALEIGSTHSLSFGITATQLLFNGTVFAGVGATKIYSRAAEEMYLGKKAETVAKARKAFYAVLLAKEAMQMMRSSLKNAEENLGNVKLMRSQGILSEYDELRAEVGVDNIRPLVIQAETNYSLSVIGLSSVIGKPVRETTEIAGELTFIPYDEEVIRNAEQTLVAANSNIRALRLQKEVNEAFVYAEKANYLPTLAAFGNYQYQGQKNAFQFSSGDMIASSTVGLQLSLNLFQGFQTNAKVEEAKIEVMKSETQLVNVENTLLAGLRSLTGTLSQTRKRIETQNKTVETAERGYKIVTARFLSSAATQLEVNDAQLALTQAKVNRMQAIYDYLVASAELDNILGRMPDYANEIEQ
jgi:outer membrane protein TolC